VLTDSELAIFWQAAASLSPWHCAVLRLLLLTGQRLRDISELRFDEIRDDGSIHLGKARTKNKRRHVVPLSGLARSIIASTPRVETPSDFVFTCGNWGGRPSSGWSRIKRQLDDEMRALGWRGECWRIHDLRRTFTTGLARPEVAPHVCERVLNHKSGTIKGVAAIYNRYSYASEMRDAVERWSTEVAKITGENVIKLDGRHA
jgi:integrase